MEMKFLNFFQEMALQSYNKIGFDKDPKTGQIKGHSFRDKRDRALIDNPANVQKTLDFYKNIDIDFDFYFVNKKGLSKFQQRGKVNWDFLVSKEGLGLEREQVSGIDSDRITVFFVGNSADEKQTMTAWNSAHRFGHAIRREYGFEQLTNWLEKEFNDLLKCYNIRNNEEKVKASIFNQIGTMRSARLGKIDRYFEFYYELFAQYLNSGKIKLNRLPEKIKIGFEAYGRPKFARTSDIEHVNDIIEGIENTFGYYADDALGSVVGDIFVM